MQGLVAIGCNAGTTILFRSHDKSHKVLSCADKKVMVEDLQWDRLSTSYLLIAYQSHIELWDAESAAIVHSFDKQPLNIVGISWMDWTAGNFVSINLKNSHLKVWNASQKQPLETIKIKAGEGGISAISFCSSRKHAVYASMDGSVVVYDIPSAKVLHKTPASHTETIFACKFCPTNCFLFASSSYDSTVKIWNLHDFSLVRTLYGHFGVIYSVVWSPDGKLLAGSFSTGEMVIWDSETGHELARYKQHTKAVYTVLWNPMDERVLLTGSGDGTVIIYDVDLDYIKDISNNTLITGSRRRPSPSTIGSNETFTQPTNKRTIAHPAAVYGCAWSTFQATIFSTCCHDGLVRIFNYIMGGGELLYTLRGHNARSFSCEWSPIMPGILATNSDDMMIMIWDINERKEKLGSSLEPKQRLIGHRNNVRALCWSYEYKNILLSGSWDSTIRVWDVVSGHCLALIKDHNSDVYCIASHKQLPFTFLSCSRDNTMRLWELGGITKLMRYFAVWDGHFGRLLPSDRDSVAGAEGPSVAEVSVFSQWKEANGFSVPVNKSEESKEAGDKSPLQTVKDPRYYMPPTLFGMESKSLHSQLTDGDVDLSDLLHGSPSPSRSPKRRLEQNLPTDNLRIANIYYRLFTYFNGANGSMDLWENVITILENKKAIRTSFFQAITSSSAWLRATSARQILHESEVLGQSKLEARKLATHTKVSMKKSDLSNEENHLLAAYAYMRLGDFARYCAIMVELGKWEAALAVAPCVSLEYWRYLSYQYAQHLKDQSSEMSIPYLISVGKDADAVDYYLNRGDKFSAMTIAKMSEARTDVIPDLSAEAFSGFEHLVITTPKGGGGLPLSPAGQMHLRNNHENANSPKGLNRKTLHSVSMTNIDIVLGDMPSSPTGSQNLANHTRERTDKEAEDARSLVRSVAHQASQHALRTAQPLLAAAHLLSVEDTSSCLDLLMACQETDLAYAIAKALKLDTTRIAVVWADQCAALGAVNLALEILDDIRNSAELERINNGHTAEKDGKSTNHPVDVDKEIRLLLSKHCTETQANEIILARRLTNVDVLLEKAREDEAIGSDGDAITSYVMARQYTQAARHGIQSLQRVVGDAFNITSNTKKLLYALKHVRARELEGELRTKFLCYLLWFTAHEAALKGAFQAAHTMLNVLLDYAVRTEFPVDATSIQYQMLFFMIYGGDDRAFSLLSTILSASLPSGAVREGLRALSALLREEKGWVNWVRTLSTKVTRPPTTSGTSTPSTAASVGRPGYDGSASPIGKATSFNSLASHAETWATNGGNVSELTYNLLSSVIT